MTLPNDSRSLFPRHSFFPALLREARRKLDRFPAGVPLQRQNRSISLYPPVLHPGASFAEPTSPSSSPRQPLRHPARTGRSRCRCHRSLPPPPSRGKFGEGINPGTTPSSSTTRSEPDVLLVSFSSFSFFFFYYYYYFINKQTKQNKKKKKEKLTSVYLIFPAKP